MCSAVGLDRFFAPVQTYLVAIVILTPLATLGAVLSLAGMAVARQRVGLLAAALLVAALVASQVPAFVAATAPRAATDLTVLSANLEFGRADAAAVVAHVRAHRVDLLAAQELTPAAVARLDAAGLATLLPYSELSAQDGSTGTGLWSRYPLTDGHPLAGYVAAPVEATLTLADGRTVTVLSVHPQAPWPPGRAGQWARELAAIGRVVTATAGPLVVAGDFNATRDHRAFRRLLTHGVADAADQAGAGWLWTFPAGHWYPPLAGLDHVLTRGIVARRVTRLVTPGTDHRSLLAVLAVPDRA